MSPLDKQTLERRLCVQKQILKAQHSLPKLERNQREIDNAKIRIRIIRKWLGDKEEVVAVTAPVIKKSEFIDQFKKEFEILEPDSMIKINNITELDVAWPNIAGKNVTVEAPPEVKAEIVRRIRLLRKQQKVNGFR